MYSPRIVIIAGDLVEQDVDAIVNAANNDLVLGGGVAGAIRKRGGPAIQDECTAVGRVSVGEAAITTGGELPARYVIHAASMSLGGRTTAASLRSSMTHVFRLARTNDVQTMAIPAVGTGIAGFPMDECARIMARSLAEALAIGWEPQEVRFVLYGNDARHVFEVAFHATFEG
jgi:O-acetyl-ADP-ribose deacetylase (regulator of RNase III)